MFRSIRLTFSGHSPIYKIIFQISFREDPTECEPEVRKKLHLERSYKKPETAKLTLGKAESNFLEHLTSFATTTPNFEQHLESFSSYNFKLLQHENC